ncbi:MAG TPA: ABC transporter substrate-binding protein [Terriglobia bacterium]|nr:ABC transporter substrate-binding protein [Terriglobia bacterium]
MKTIRKSLLLAVCVLAAGIGRPLEAQQLTKVRVSLGDVSLNKLIFTLAQDAGIYRKHGLEVEQFITAGAAARAARAYVNIPKDKIGQGEGGQVHFGIGGGAPLTVNRATNALAGDRIIVASTDHVVRWHIVAQPEITRPEQLKGKKIGYSGYGAMTHFEALAFAQIMGWDPVFDIALYENGLALDTFEDRTLDAFVADELVYTMALSRGHKALVDLSQYNIPIPGSGVTVSRKWAQANPDIVRRFLRATVESIALLKQNKEAVFKTISSWYGITDREQQELLYRDMAKLPRKPYPNVEGIKKVMELYDSAGMRMLKPEDVYDDSYIRELDESGFIDSLYR